MYIFNIYSSSTIHQTRTFNLKCIFVNFHAHPLSKNWLSQHIFKKRLQIDASDLNLKVAKCIFSKSTPHQQYTRQEPSTSNAYLSTSTHTLWAKIGLVSIFLKRDCKLTQVTSIWKLLNVYWAKRLVSGVLSMWSRFWKYTFGTSQIEVIWVRSGICLIKICWLSQFLLRGCAWKWTNM